MFKDDTGRDDRDGASMPTRRCTHRKVKVSREKSIHEASYGMNGRWQSRVKEQRLQICKPHNQKVPPWIFRVRLIFNRTSEGGTPHVCLRSVARLRNRLKSDFLSNAVLCSAPSMSPLPAGDAHIDCFPSRNLRW
jgi:hypothetical protein